MNLDNNQSQQQGGSKPTVTRVDTDDDIAEKDLKRNSIFGDNDNPTQVQEGKPMGGHKFGEESHPPTGDAPNNPSQNAGYSNAYFAKTEPSEEYTDNNNFKPESQQGEPDYEQHKTAALPDNTNNGHTAKADEQAPEHTANDQQGHDYGDNDPESAAYRERAEQQKTGGG